MGTLFSQDTGCDNNVIEKDVILSFSLGFCQQTTENHFKPALVPDLKKSGMSLDICQIIKNQEKFSVLSVPLVTNRHSQWTVKIRQKSKNFRPRSFFLFLNFRAKIIYFFLPYRIPKVYHD